MSDQQPDDDRTIIKPVTRMQPTIAVPRPDPALAAAIAHPDHGNGLPIGTYLGEFEITGMVGEGGFGIVYLAWDHSLERRVALKEYMPSALAQRTGGTQVSVKSERHRDTFEAGLKSFVNEARLLAQFDHASLVKVYRFWEAHGTAYMVMPFYEGQTLKDTLKALPGPPDEAWLMTLLAPLTEALQVIHAEQCYHRDIAPDNIILLKGSNRPLLLDFGAARRVIGDMTQALTVILKPGYAPVEQYAEVPGMKQGGWTDLYALAAVVYYAILGKTPPPSVGRLMQDNYTPLSQAVAGRYSDRFLKAIDHGLVVKPEERTQSIEQLRQELGLDDDSAASHSPASTRQAPGAAGGPGQTPRATAAATGRASASVSAPSSTGSRTGLMIGGGAVALAALGGLAYWLLAPHGSTAPATANASGTATTGNAAPAAQPATVATNGQTGGTVAAPAGTTPATTAAIPTPTPAPAPASMVDSGPFDPVREFRRIVDASSPDFVVDASPAKPAFRIGHDRLSFTVESARDGFVYVLLNSTDGAFMQLFPNKMAKSNRIRAGQKLTLPHSTWPMDVAGPAGTDHFVVIVSSTPRDFKDTGVKPEAGFGQFPKGDDAKALMRGHAARTPLFAGRPVCEGGAADCPDLYGAAYFSSQEVK